MTQLKLTFTLCLMTLCLIGLAQKSKDTTYNFTPHQIRVIALVFNDYDRVSKNLQYTDSIAQVRQFKIDNLIQMEQVRANQLILANSELRLKDSQIKSLKRTNLVLKIAAVSAVLVTIFIFR